MSTPNGAAHDGHLAAIEGFGEKRVAGIADSLATRLGRVRQAAPLLNDVSVSESLDVDREYRESAAAGTLVKIAPRRFNPKGEAWLPILHTQRGNRHYSAMFSNTARAHDMGKTGDWVVIYWDAGIGEPQSTVVTPWQGPLAGHHVVRRGRETECAEFYKLAA
ncbi:MAG TPA: hypothetical protein VK789_29580 [Bryobacteraceae bacterium]|jgi:DNA polymerase (family 10)|nr:hypothetical protein [Bryobacteraceae bacterium]